jgi:Bacterial transglutaminase-like N-terminal region
MVILSINHITTYRYRRPVGFGAHRMMLRPRDDENQKVLRTELSIVPNPLDVPWRRDRFCNHVAIARFATNLTSYALSVLFLLRNGDEVD